MDRHAQSGPSPAGKPKFGTRVVNRKLASLVLVILFILVGCASTTTSAEEPIMPTNTELIPSSTSVPTETKFPIFTATLINPTPTLYLTPLPTFSVEQERVKFYQFYNFINGCRLPCLWGITPGVTTWTEMRQFINRFYSHHYIDEIKWSITKSETSDTYAWYVKHPICCADYAVPVFFEVQSNIISAIQIDRELSGYLFPLDRLLTEYGQPDRILLNTSTNKGDITVYLVDVMLVYSDEYIFSRYQFNEFASTNDTKRRVCLNDNDWKPMILLSPGQELNEDFSIWKPIAEFSEYDTKTFYERFRYNGNKCFEISKDAWN
jgi:hypothetical protein